MDFITNNYNVDICSIKKMIDQYGLLGSAKLLSESIGENIDNAYIAGVLYALYLQENIKGLYSFYKENASISNLFVRDFFLENYDMLVKIVDHTRDYGYQFSSVKKIALNYIFKHKGNPIESIQWCWMRIAIQVAAPLDWKSGASGNNQGKDPIVYGGEKYPWYMREVIDSYEIFSGKEGIHGTPTCINSGYCIPQLESCFLARIGDNMLSIGDVKKFLLMGSKCNGGFGIYVGDIRHSRVANRGITKGVPGLAKTINGLIPYADQLGSRPMAVTLFLPIWHCDIDTFIQMKDNNAPLDIRASGLNYCICIPDLFQKRVLEGNAPVSGIAEDPNKGMWHTFCPRECKMLWVKTHGGNPDNTYEVDAAPSLCDVWGKQFEEYYLMCEQAGIAKKVYRARDLDGAIHTMRCRIGEPYLFYIDNVNRKSNHSHMGTIVQSNLCVHGDTQILTNKGYVSIKNRKDIETIIWNGFEWSTVTPRQTGKDQSLLSVRFSNGSTLKCTPYHKFHLKGKNGTVDAISLNPGDTLIDYSLPRMGITYKTEEETYEALNDMHRRSLDIKMKRLSEVVGQASPYVSDSKGNKVRISNEEYISHAGIYPEDHRPTGFIDYSIEKEIIEEICPISNITVESVIDEGEKGDTYCFTEEGRHMGVFNGILAGNCTEIMQYTSTADSKWGEMIATCDLATVNLASMVRKAIPSKEGEGHIQNKESISVSFDWKRLGEVVRQLVRNLDRVLDRTSGVIPNEGQKLCEEMMKDENPLIRETAMKLSKYIISDPTYNSRRMTRSIGIGCMGMSSCFSLLGMEYCSKEAIELGSKIRACIYWHSLDESVSLGQSLGIYPTFVGSPISKGILQMDMWVKETEHMKDYLSKITITPSSSMKLEYQDMNRISLNKASLVPYTSPLFSEIYDPKLVDHYQDAIKRYSYSIIDPISFGVQGSWDDMRIKVSKGLRNSLTTCQMPNSMTSEAFGVSPGAEPYYEILYSSNSNNGSDMTMYDALRDTLILHGLYDSKKIASYLINNKGRIEGISSIYDSKEMKLKAQKIEKLFMNGFSINKKKYILFMQRMGYSVDQGQSTNIFFDKPNAGYLSRISKLAWANGAKTEYYLRRLAEDKIDPFLSKLGKSTKKSIQLDIGTTSSCTSNGDCISCQ